MNRLREQTPVNKVAINYVKSFHIYFLFKKVARYLRFSLRPYPFSTPRADAGHKVLSVSSVNHLSFYLFSISIISYGAVIVNSIRPVNHSLRRAGLVVLAVAISVCALLKAFGDKHILYLLQSDPFKVTVKSIRLP